ncbi:hypothetical protein WJX74_010386 [Apatococcus lobatus]|uniref:Uncharacterized protein n=1 Tax=Apatococcus lobatus TaxID=904363 RepID=A0AAW1RND9_9CHLO
MAEDPSAWTCTCAAAVPLALGLRHCQQSEGFRAGNAAFVLRDLSGSRYEAAYEFLLGSILHEARSLQQAPAEEDHSNSSERGARHILLSDLYRACDSVAAQTCLQSLLCSPVNSIAGVCLQGLSAIETLQQELPAGASIVHPLLSQAVGLAVFHVLFELKAVSTLEPDTQPKIKWLAAPPQSAVHFLVHLADSNGKTANSAQEVFVAADLQQAGAIVPDGFLPVPAGFLQPIAALLHEFAAQMLAPRELSHLTGQPQLRLYPAMNTIEANRWWPELLERLEEAVLPNFEVEHHELEDPPPTGIARFCTLPPTMEADFLLLLWQEIMARLAGSSNTVHVLAIASDARYLEEIADHLRMAPLEHTAVLGSLLDPESLQQSLLGAGVSHIQEYLFVQSVLESFLVTRQHMPLGHSENQLKQALAEHMRCWGQLVDMGAPGIVTVDIPFLPLRVPVTHAVLNWPLDAWRAITQQAHISSRSLLLAAGEAGLVPRLGSGSCFVTSYTAKTLSHLDKMPFQIFAAGEEHADAIQHLQQHVQPSFMGRELDEEDLAMDLSAEGALNLVVRYHGELVAALLSTAVAAPSRGLTVMQLRFVAVHPANSDAAERVRNFEAHGLEN